jgi:hypothetical protein
MFFQLFKCGSRPLLLEYLPVMINWRLIFISNLCFVFGNVNVRNYQLVDSDMDEFNLCIVIRNNHYRTNAQKGMFLMKDSARLNKGIKKLIPFIYSCGLEPIFKPSLYTALTLLPWRPNMNVKL